MWDVHEGGLKSRINSPLLSRDGSDPARLLSQERGKKSPEFAVGLLQDPLFLMVEGDFKQYFIGLNRNLIVLNLIVLNT